MTAKRSPKFKVGDFQIDSASLTIIGPLGETTVEAKVMQVLTLMAEAKGETVLRETFMDRVWGVEFGSDESLTRAISILRKIFKDQRGRRAMIETVPRKGYRLVVPVTELSSLDMSGSETAPKKISPEELTSSPQNISDSEPRKLQLNPIALAAFALLLLMTLGMTSVWLLDRSSETAPQDTTERHLVRFDGFENQEGDEALVRSLNASLPDTLSSASIPVITADASQGASPEFQLSGSHWIDEEIIVTVELTHTSTDRLLLSETYRYDPDDRRDLDHRIAMELASVLNCVMEWRGDEYPNSVQSLAAYVRYCESSMQRQQRDYVTLSQPIYDAEPDNPNAVALHAYEVWQAATRSRESSVAERKRRVAEAEKLIKGALDANPDSLIVKGVTLVIDSSEDDLVSVSRQYPRVVSNPSLPGLIYSSYAEHLRRVGRNLEARQVLSRYVDGHLFDPNVIARVGWLHALEGNYIQANRYFDMAERIEPDNGELIARRRQTTMFYGDREELQTILGSMPMSEMQDSSSFLECTRVFLTMRLSEQSDADDLNAVCVSGRHPFYVARYLGALGEIDAAYEAIKDYDWSTHSGSTIVLFYREMAEFRADPRFWPLMEEIGLYDYWTETEQWPDFCLFEDHPGRCPDL